MLTILFIRGRYFCKLGNTQFEIQRRIMRKYQKKCLKQVVDVKKNTIINS
jgi:hypothetical protein